jgi:phage-related minor tail protein
VNKLLKMDPGNADLLAQKQKYLTDAIDATKKKLEEEKSALEQLKNGPQTEDTVRQQEALTREIADTEQQLKSLTKEYQNFGSVAGQELQTAGKKMQAIGDKISGAGTKMLPVTGVVAAAGVAAVKTAADFDSGMSQVSAVSGATGSDLEALRDKAREMGEKTKFSASEAAEAMNYMAMAGWKTEDMLGGIEGIMNLAAASGEDLATTSDIVTDALTAFGLTAQDSGHFADILAAASSNANTNVSMMGETFKYAAPVAGALGFSAEDTAEAIGLMANAGIKSSQAGTSLRTIMTNLTGPITLVGEKLGEVTVETANSDGSMRSLRDILADLRGH